MPILNQLTVNEKLDEIALKQLAWKNTKFLTACLLIAHKALEREFFYPDEITFDFLLSDEDRNLIGSSWRMCSKTLDIIQKTGKFRRSTTEASNGRTVFQYRLCDKAVAAAFLRRYDLKRYESLVHPQLDLAI